MGHDIDAIGQTALNPMSSVLQVIANLDHQELSLAYAQTLARW
jgi:hypothetical protein